MKPKVNDVVQLLAAKEKENLHSGAVGVIIFEYDMPREAYEVEFPDEKIQFNQVVLEPDEFIIISSRNGDS